MYVYILTHENPNACVDARLYPTPDEAVKVMRAEYEQVIKEIGHPKCHIWLVDESEGVGSASVDTDREHWSWELNWEQTAATIGPDALLTEAMSLFNSAAESLKEDDPETVIANLKTDLAALFK